MKYVSLDLETTSLNHEEGSIIEIGMVCDDTDLPLQAAHRAEAYVLPTGPIVGQAVALAMNAAIIQQLANLKSGKPMDGDWIHEGNIVQWMIDHFQIAGYSPDSRINFAGKNFAGFDLQWLRRLPGWGAVPYSHRFIDPGSMYLTRDDTAVPNTLKCMAEAGIGDLTVKHRALQDAMVVCRLIRWKLGVECM